MTDALDYPIMEGPYKMVADRDTMIHREGDDVVIVSKRYVDGKLAETTQRRIVDKFGLSLGGDSMTSIIGQPGSYLIDVVHPAPSGYAAAAIPAFVKFRRRLRMEDSRQRMRSYRRKL